MRPPLTDKGACDGTDPHCNDRGPRDHRTRLFAGMRVFRRGHPRGLRSSGLAGRTTPRGARGTTARGGLAGRSTPRGAAGVTERGRSFAECPRAGSAPILAKHFKKDPEPSVWADRQSSRDTRSTRLGDTPSPVRRVRPFRSQQVRRSRRVRPLPSFGFRRSRRVRPFGDFGFRRSRTQVSCFSLIHRLALYWPLCSPSPQSIPKANPQGCSKRAGRVGKI